MPSGKASRAARQAAGSRALPNVSLVQDSKAAALSGLKQGNKKAAVVFKRLPLPAKEEAARRWLKADRYVTEQRLAASERVLVEYMDKEALVQSSPELQESLNHFLMQLHTDRRRLEVLTEMESSDGTAVEKVNRLKIELIKAVIPLASGYVYNALKPSIGRDDAQAVVAGLALSQFQQTPSVEEAMRDAAPGVSQPLLYAAIRAIAYGNPDDVDTGEHHILFKQAHQSINAERAETSNAVPDSDMVEDFSVDTDSDPQRLLLAEFEERERSEQIARFMESLTEKQRTVLLMQSKGLSRREMAERMGVGEETIKTHLAAIRKHAKTFLERGELQF